MLSQQRYVRRECALESCSACLGHAYVKNGMHKQGLANRIKLPRGYYGMDGY
jgi:hypothetical protein